MGIALLTLSSLFAPVQAFTAWLSPAPPRLVRPRPANAIKTVASNDQLIRTTGPKSLKNHPARPLRVVRLVEAGHRPGSAGRMVISGRMADVCAELDRLERLAERDTLH